MNRKRMLASLLALAMVLSAVTFAAAAVTGTGFSDMVGNPHANHVTYLRALGIAKGDGGGRFNPNANLTRQEFVTFVARLAGQEAAAAAVAGTKSTYHDDADIADWARGAVILAANNNWVKGYDDGKFHPTDSLTYAQAVTVLIRVLGHEATTVGEWPASHLIKAANLHLNEGVSVDSNAPISRADMGRLLYNSLFIDRFVLSGGTWLPERALMGANTITGVVKQVDASNIELHANPPAPAYARPLTAETVLIGADNLNALKDLNVRLTVSTTKDDPAAKVTIIEVLDSLSTSGPLTFDRFDTAPGGGGPIDVLVFTDGTRVPYDNSSGNEATVSVNGSTPIAPKGPGPIAGFPTWDQALKPGNGVVITYSGNNIKHLDVIHFDWIDVPLTADAIVQAGAGKHSYLHIGFNVALTDAVMSLNGQPAAVSDLKQHDVASVAFRFSAWGFQGWMVQQTAAMADPAFAPIAYAVEAVRSTATGEVTKNRTTLPGPVYHTTLSMASGSQEFEWISGTQVVHLPAEGAIVTLLLNGEGKAVRTALAPTPIASGDYAVLKSVTTSGGSSEVTLDVNGNTFTMPVAANATVGPAGHINTDRIGEALLIVISGGKVTHAQTALNIPAAVFEVVTVDADSGLVVIEGGGDTIVTEKTLQYAGVGANNTEIGDPVTLKAGDKVKIGHTGFANQTGIKLLLLQPLP